VPELCERQTNYNAYLPATTNHPNASGLFITPPTTNNPGAVDLGLWNVFANSDFPGPQPGLNQILPQIIPLTSPVLSAATVNGPNLIFSGTNGTPGWPYLILSTTNLMLPTAQWQVVASNDFDSRGDLTLSVTINPATTQNYYAVLVGAGSPELALPHMIALYKTPTVRDISSSEPYLHTGRMDTVEDVITFYQTMSGLAQSGAMRNADPQLSGISLSNAVVAPLAAFLRSLNEDYTDIPCPCQ
jgi:hypothetical protein